MHFLRENEFLQFRRENALCGFGGKHVFAI